MKPEIICAQMQQYLTQVRAVLVRAPNFAPFVGQLDRLQAQLASMTGDCNAFSAQALSMAYSDLRRVTHSAEQTRNAIRQKTDRTRYSSAEKRHCRRLRPWMTS